MWLVASRRPIALGLNTQLQRPSNRGKEAAGWVQARSSSLPALFCAEYSQVAFPGPPEWPASPQEQLTRQWEWSHSQKH